MAKQVESPKKGKKYLTPKNKKFIDQYIKNGGNATEAAWKACDVTTQGGAQISGSYMKNKLKEEIDKRLERYGLTEELVVGRHKKIVEKGKDPVAMDGIKTYYKLVDDMREDDDREITVRLKY